MVIGHTHGESLAILRETEPGVFELGAEPSAFPMKVVVSVPGILLLLLSIAAWWLLGLGAGRQAFTEGVVRTDMLGWYLRSGGMSWRALTEPFAQTVTVLLPWTVVLPLAIWGALRAQPTDPEQSRPARLLLIWAGVVFVAIGASLQQRMRYYLPLCPPVAILIAAWCARVRTAVGIE